MKQLRSKFPLSSDDCELLLEFEKNPSLQDLAMNMQRDHSIITRALKRISESFPVVDKTAGKWVLTEMGRKVNEASRSALTNQFSALNQHSTLRLGTNREFAARVLAADFKALQATFPQVHLSVQTYEQGTEKALLEGHIDLGLDCDRPFAPDISYRLAVDEPILAVASKNFIRAYKKEISAGLYMKLPHLLCERLHPDKILLRTENELLIEASFNDIATTRAVCTQGVGWALLPLYAIKAELSAGLLVQIDPTAFGKSKYGVWWLRSRPQLKAIAENLISWLQSQKL